MSSRATATLSVLALAVTALSAASADGAAKPHRVLYLHDAAGTRRVAAAPSIGGVAFAGDELTWRAFGSAHSVAG